MTDEEHKEFIKSQLEKVETKLRNEGFFDNVYYRMWLKKVIKYTLVAVALILFIYFLM